MFRKKAKAVVNAQRAVSGASGEGGKDTKWARDALKAAQTNKIASLKAALSAPTANVNERVQKTGGLIYYLDVLLYDGDIVLEAYHEDDTILDLAHRNKWKKGVMRLLREMGVVCNDSSMQRAERIDIVEYAIEAAKEHDHAVHTSVTRGRSVSSRPSRSRSKSRSKRISSRSPPRGHAGSSHDAAAAANAAAALAAEELEDDDGGDSWVEFKTWFRDDVGMPDANEVVDELAPLLEAIGAEVPADLKAMLAEDDPNGWNAEMVDLIAKALPNEFRDKFHAAIANIDLDAAAAQYDVDAEAEAAAAAAAAAEAEAAAAAQAEAEAAAQAEEMRRLEEEAREAGRRSAERKALAQAQAEAEVAARQQAAADKAAAAAAAAAPAYQKHYDENTQRYYYIAKDTGLSFWAVWGEEEWMEVLEEASQRTYHVHSETGETKWPSESPVEARKSTSRRPSQVGFRPSKSTAGRGITLDGAPGATHYRTDMKDENNRPVPVPWKEPPSAERWYEVMAAQAVSRSRLRASFKAKLMRD